MEKTENEKYGITSWIIFIFTVSIVLISLLPVIFPALFSETLFKTELSQYDIPKSFSLEPFEIGGLAIPLILTNIIVFSLFYFFRRKNFYEKINSITKFQLSRKITIIAIIIILAIYVSVSYSEIGVGNPLGHNDEPYEDWKRLKHKLTYMENIWPEQITSFEPHLKHSLLKTSEIVFGNYFVTPFLSSIGLLIITYLFTSEITNSRIAGLISLLLVLQSNLFLNFDTSAAFASFWIFFYLSSLYLIIKIWPLSPLFYVLSILAKTLTVFFAPMSIFFVINSDISRQRKIAITLAFLIIIIIGIVVSTTQSKIEFESNFDGFWLGFTAFAFQMRLDSVFVLFLLPVIVGLFIISKTNRYANSIQILIVGTLLMSPFVTGLTDLTNQPYRFLPFLVFFSVGVGMILTNRMTR